MKPDPAGLPRNPFHVFLFGIACLNGAALLFGLPTSSAIDAVMPTEVTRVYGLMLLISTLAVLVGMYWQGDPRTGLLAKKFGYFGLAITTGIYSAAVWFVVGLLGTLPASVTIVFSMICFWQYRSMNKLIKRFIAGRLNADDLGSL